MSDRRAKKYLNKQQKENKKELAQVQPKILLKATKEPKESSQNSQISIASREPKPITLVTSTAFTASVSETTANSSSLTIQSKESSSSNTQQQTPAEEPITEMKNPITVFSHSSNPNLNVSKVLQKNNTDFFVVGVIGCQGVGKSTILNLLGMDNLSSNFEEFYVNLFEKYDGILFPVKIKSMKGPSVPRTESLQMFINYKDRLILLDSSPVLCNANKKDGTTNEIEDLRNIILMLTVCHLVIVVQDSHFNMNLIRLLQFAELAKSQQDPKFTNNYYPNILFVKNFANRMDFLGESKDQYREMISFFFRESKLKIYFGQTDALQKKSKFLDHENCVNYFVFPEVTGKGLVSYHSSLDITIKKFRNTVFMTPRNQICSGANEFNEGIWFELLTTTAMSKNDFFLSTYEEIRRFRTHSSEPQT